MTTAPGAKECFYCKEAKPLDSFTPTTTKHRRDECISCGESVTKKCSKCHTVKSISEFGKNVSSNTPSGRPYLRPECIECGRNSNRSKRKAVSESFCLPDEFCGRCGKKAKLIFDHDHQTGEHRGWTCERCNLGMGKLGDTKKDILEALIYLYLPISPQKHEQVKDILPRFQHFAECFFKSIDTSVESTIESATKEESNA